jgi:hypothetical protein
VNNSVMSCERALVLLALDASELDPGERARARLHASRCPRCGSAYDTGAGAVTSRGFADPRPESAASLRVALALVSTIQLVLAVPWLFGHSLIPDAHVAVAHLTRDGALGVVIGALGLVTAWRPRYVYGIVIIGLLVSAAQLIAGLTDHDTSPARPSFELVHVLVVIILLGLFAVAADLARRATPKGKPAPPALHSR